MRQLLCVLSVLLAINAEAATYFYNAFTTNPAPDTTNVVLSIAGSGGTLWGTNADGTITNNSNLGISVATGQKYYFGGALGPYLNASGGTLVSSGPFTSAGLLTAANGITVTAGTITGNGSGLTGSAGNMTNVLRGFITPYDVGAVGDGTADDTAAMQKWLNIACWSNLVAFLPPAVGSYYKITDTLQITNGQWQVCIEGAGGVIHSSDFATWTHARIHQATAGKSGIIITNTSSGVSLRGFMISAPTKVLDGGSTLPTAGTKGIAFDGNATDSDCVKIEGLGINGFGAGLFVASVADGSIQQCSFGGNNDGLYVGLGQYTTNGPIINNISVRGCQLSYNYSNQVHITAGQNIMIDTSDIAQTGGTPHALGVRLERGTLILLNDNLENDQLDSPIVVASSSSSNLKIIGGGSQGTASGCYTVVSTNAFLDFVNPSLSGVNSDNGYAVFHTSDPTAVRSAAWMKYLLYDGVNPPFQYVSQSYIPTFPGAHSLLSWGQMVFEDHSGGFDNTTAFLIGAKSYAYTSDPNTVREVDLLEFDREQHYTGIQGTTVTSTNGFSSLKSVAAASTAITFPLTTVNWTNTQGFNIVLYIDNSGITGTVIKKNNQQVFSSLIGDAVLMLKPGDFFSETYTVGTPSARWEPQ